MADLLKAYHNVLSLAMLIQDYKPMFHLLRIKIIVCFRSVSRNNLTTFLHVPQFIDTVKFKIGNLLNFASFSSDLSESNNQ